VREKGKTERADLLTSSIVAATLSRQGASRSVLHLDWSGHPAAVLRGGEHVGSSRREEVNEVFL